MRKQVLDDSRVFDVFLDFWRLTSLGGLKSLCRKGLERVRLAPSERLHGLLCRFARKYPQAVPRQRLDGGGGDVRQLCRELRLVISLNRCLDILQQIDAGFETDT